MKKRITKLFIVLCLLVFVSVYRMNAKDNFLFFEKQTLSALASDTGSINGITYKFFQKDTFCSFRASFVIKAQIECITDVSFNIDHKKQYTHNVKSIQLLKEGREWYIASYTIEKPFFTKNTSVWIIISHSDKNKISFKMISNHCNVKICDIVQRSSGYYLFEAVKKGIKISYYQESFLKQGGFVKLYISAVKNDAVKILTDYKEYLENTCLAD